MAERVCTKHLLRLNRRKTEVRAGTNPINGKAAIETHPYPSCRPIQKSGSRPVRLRFGGGAEHEPKAFSVFRSRDFSRSLFSSPSFFPLPPLPWTRPGRRIGPCWEATRAPTQGPKTEAGCHC